MKRLALLTILIFAVTAAVLAFESPGRAQETAGGPCIPGEPLDLKQGYSADIGAPIAIPDNAPGGIENCMSVPAGDDITGLMVSLNITHTFVGDLFISLYHATSGTTVVLLDRPGFPAAPGGCSGDNIRVTFSDAAASAAEIQCEPIPPSIYGTFRPHQALSAFNGDAIGGNWRLLVSDNAGADVGSLVSWSLLPAFGPVPGNGDADCSGTADAIDATLILQRAAGFKFLLHCDAAGDVNGNGMLDAIDATLVLQYAAGLIPSLPPLL